ncbi:peptide chain release factor N(5)-glutamine methyltransferase [Caenimonas sp. SL110]|uniref:peptide chain release factor N(5)-glutamine methyltransferase n=1 Tax=Caenimonas sp. SL110 TaxID=1450524 RepID=UPI000652F385|nr:peptide chain release factor N(5)-glutamine methyltransferase [Caenimonas sp. SL110]
MTIAQALAAAAALGLERLDAQLLLLHVLGKAQSDRGWLLAHDRDEPDADAQARYAQLCARRVAGEPLAYIVGRKEFFGLDLLVDARVLVPRPDTEVLVEWALDLLPQQLPCKVVDLGTGSGAIALALKHQRPLALVDAVDSSAGALEVAQVNARRLGLQVTFQLGSWLRASTSRYDLIVSNPPYIRADDSHLAALVAEPLSALASGTDGLDDLRQIIGQAPSHLTGGGWLLLEHGWDQAPAVRDLLATAGFTEVATRRDLAGHERCSGGRWLELG